jgi:glycosyltransferase involved in cell wall biosynthesis
MTRPIRVLELRSVRGTGGGPEKTILLGAARTDPRRFAVTVCYLRDARDGVFNVTQKAADLPVDYVELVERHSLDWTLWFNLRKLVRDRSIDIVHAHDYKTDLLAWLVAKTEGITAMSTVHGWTGHSRRERWFYYPIDKRILGLFSHLVAVSNDVRRELVAHGTSPSRVVTIVNGIDHTAFRRDPIRAPSVRRTLGLCDEDLVVGAVGRLEPQKRFDLLIEAVAQLQPRKRSLKLLIVGDGSLRRRLIDQIEGLRLSRSCSLLGHRTDIIDLHHAFDLFVQSSDYEGTSNALLEAMALETPIVATDVGGTGEIIRHGVDGLIVSPGDLRSLARTIEIALGDRDASASRVASARHRVETDLSFDARMNALEAIYVELFGRRWPARHAPCVPART